MKPTFEDPTEERKFNLWAFGTLFSQFDLRGLYLWNERHGHELHFSQQDPVGRCIPKMKDLYLKYRHKLMTKTGEWVEFSNAPKIGQRVLLRQTITCEAEWDGERFVTNAGWLCPEKALSRGQKLQWKPLDE